MPNRRFLSTLVDGVRRYGLLPQLLFVALVGRAQAQDRPTLEAQGRCLDSLIEWGAVTAMLTAPDVSTLDGAYANIWRRSIATDTTYGLKRYKLKPDAESTNLMLGSVPRNRLDAWLLGQLSNGAADHAPEGSLRVSMDELEDDYYETLSKVIARTGRGYREYLRLGSILEGGVAELVAAKMVQLWAANPKAFTDALAGLDRQTRSRACVMFSVEPEPLLKDRRIQRLCPKVQPTTSE